MFYVIWSAVIALCIVADQVSKYFVVQNIELDRGVVPVIPNVLEFIYVRNEGAAFGSLQGDGGRIIFMTLSVIAIVGVLVYMFVKKPDSWLFCLSLSLIAGGGIGNMIDRVSLGYVVDMIHLDLFNEIKMFASINTVFNVADSFVCIGAAVLVLGLTLEMIAEMKKEKLAKSSKEDKE